MGQGDRPCTMGQVVFVAATKGSLSCTRAAHCAAALSDTMENVTHAANQCHVGLSGECLYVLPMRALLTKSMSMDCDVCNDANSILESNSYTVRDNSSPGCVDSLANVCPHLSISDRLAEADAKHKFGP